MQLRCSALLGVELVQPRGRKVRLREHRDGVAPALGEHGVRQVPSAAARGGGGVRRGGGVPAVEQGAPPHVLDQPGLRWGVGQGEEGERRGGLRSRVRKEELLVRQTEEEVSWKCLGSV